MTVLEVGPGMGFFSLPLADLVGPQGQVVCVDVQERMLDKLRQRARKAGLLKRIQARVCRPDSLGVKDFNGRFDFALLFAVAHEAQNPSGFFAEVASAMKAGSFCLLAEPRGRVSALEFEETVRIAESAGLKAVDRPRIRLSRSAVLKRD
jgi:ubiquinone/menaquinone biosynthesis C-methylase UbiE